MVGWCMLRRPFGARLMALLRECGALTFVCAWLHAATGLSSRVVNGRFWGCWFFLPPLVGGWWAISMSCLRLELASAGPLPRAVRLGAATRCQRLHTAEVVNAVFVQQTMKTASSDEDLAFKQREKDIAMPLRPERGGGTVISVRVLL